MLWTCLSEKGNNCYVQFFFACVESKVCGDYMIAITIIITP